eukprot:COSAG06_NODE_5_length_38423_cov_121.612645_12_plen_118_part_00
MSSIDRRRYALNKAMASWEGYNSTDPKTGGQNSNLRKPLAGRPDVNCTTNDGDCWTHRRHARRVYEISQTFEQVFGKGSLNDKASTDATTRARAAFSHFLSFNSVEICLDMLPQSAI